MDGKLKKQLSSTSIGHQADTACLDQDRIWISFPTFLDVVAQRSPN